MALLSTDEVVAQDELADDTELARRIAEAAGSALLELRAQHAELGETDSSDLRKRGDRLAHVAITSLLAEHRPGDAVLSEEGKDDPVRLTSRRVWIVDPLDGTREYGEAGRHDWAVHVALWEDGQLRTGAVALPALGTVLTTDSVAGSAADLPPLQARRPRLAVSRSRATDLVKALASHLGAELVPLGSAGYKTSAVVLGEVDAYVHSGGQYEWDSAAPVVVARAAGLHTSRIDGSALTYNSKNPLLPDLVVCRPELAEAILAFLSDPASTGESQPSEQPSRQQTK